MNARPLYIFDLDGTLALIDHRRHLIAKPKPNWRAFYAACVMDQPNLPVIKTLLTLSSSSDIWIWSGRSDEVRFETVRWIVSFVDFDYDFQESNLRMRQAGDNQPDTTLKKGWLDAMSAEDRARLVAVFDDRDRLVKMYRECGVPCFQVAPGDF